MVLANRLVVTLMVMAFAILGAAMAQTAPPAQHVLTQANFTDLATQILTYLGFAVIAGLTVLVAVIGARRAWAFMRRFL